MIAKVQKFQSPSKAAQEFAEWASLFSGEIFVKLVAYIDESGTHSKQGALEGAREAVICGYVAPQDEWKKFCADWRRVLNKYSACYFHFWEWAEAYAAKKRSRTLRKDNPYAHLTVDELDQFIVELGQIAGGGDKIIVGCIVLTKKFQALKKEGKIAANENPYHECARKFFTDFQSSIEWFTPAWKRLKVSFFFDQSSREWEHAVTDCYREIRSNHPTFREITFADKEEHLPLQAADMVAYRMRQVTQNWVDDTIWISQLRSP